MVSCVMSEKLLEPMMLSSELKCYIQVIQTVLNTNRKEMVCNTLFACGISS